MADTRTIVICPRCGAEVVGTAKYCGMCGSSTMTVDEDADPYLGQTVAGRYRITERLASGGMGEVYVAQHDTLAQRVAVKILHRRHATDNKAVRRFFNEARTYCRVKHPHAVTLLDFGRLSDGTLYIVTEFIEGSSLTEFVAKYGHLSPSLTVRLARQLAEALAAVHAEQIIHRDLKPDNVMVTARPGGRYTTKILDFGIARILGEGEKRLTQTGKVVGTPRFMSPEQCRGGDATYRSDIYALGCILFFMLTGEPPFEGRETKDLVKRHITDLPPLDKLLSVPDIPHALVNLVQDCLRKDPEERPTDMNAVLSRLERVDSGRPTSASLSTTRPEIKRGQTIPQAFALRGAGPAALDTPAERPLTRQELPPTSLELRDTLQDPYVEDTFGFAHTVSGSPHSPVPSEPSFHDLSDSLGSDEFTWGEETDSERDLLAAPLDVHPSDFGGSQLRSSSSTVLRTLFILLVVLAAIAGGYIYFKVLPSGTHGEDGGVDTGATSAPTPAVGEDTSAGVPEVGDPTPRPEVTGLNESAVPPQSAPPSPGAADSAPRVPGGREPSPTASAASEATSAAPAPETSAPAELAPPGPAPAVPARTPPAQPEATPPEIATVTQPVPPPPTPIPTPAPPVVAPPPTPPPPPLPARPFAVVGGAREAGLAAAYLQAGDVERAAEAWSRAQVQMGAQNVAISHPVGARIAQARELIAQADRALGANECHTAEQVMVEMELLSPTLHGRYQQELERCNRRRERARGLPPRRLD